MFGQIASPLPKYASTQGSGLFLFLSNLFQVVAVIGGIYMIFQFIMAGYAYISASGDVKATQAAFDRIWQSILGMVIIASAFVIASVVTRLTGIEIINPVLNGP
ncbi:hypothetical protein KBC75_03640 [Candidatus Shapirobacteria bacterium]|nr:hypothetical protein [Candidatus Shapirobacteria bacterium]